jgi:hypothetical protein
MLTEQPAETMKGIWEYLQIKSPKHNFNNVEQYTMEHEAGWPYGDHTIRNKVEPLEKDWNQLLGKDFSDQIHKSFQWLNAL